MSNVEHSQEKNIVLIGFMACGKTMVSRQLAGALGRERVSTDEMIEAQEGCSVRDIFSRFGEEHFRSLEQEAVRSCAARKGLVIDCGGGVIMNKENLRLLKATGIVFFLNASPEAIYRRTKGRSDRPLLNVDDPLKKIKELLAVRDPHYRQAQYIVDSNDDDIGKVAHEILHILQTHRT